MSKTTALTLSAIACCSLIADTAFATQPPDVVSSDSNGNTAMGSYALDLLTTGAYNTGVGNYTLFSITTGNENTAVGNSALNNTNTASGNSAFGFSALNAVSTGNDNTAVGTYALQRDTTGGWNTAVGIEAGGASTGNYNTAIGFQTLYAQNDGSYNIGIGYQAAYFLTSGSNNIDIGYGSYSSTSSGDYSESNTIRIGQPGTQTATYVAGIRGSLVTGAAVYVTSSGQLGVLASSERYKTDIKTIADQTTRLEHLRPVSFKLKTDPKGAVQYGLIAEEVDKVFPELVIHNGDGRIEGVRYEELAPMLLSQVQQQQKQIADQSKQIADQKKMLGELRQQVAAVTELKQQVAALLKREASVENASLLHASRPDWSSSPN
jgi:hypothetical protein